MNDGGGEVGGGVPAGRRGERVATAERLALADLLAAVGPDAPTLCEGWTTRDLTAHLVVRRDRPDVQAGLVVPWLGGWSEKVRAQRAASPYADLVADVRSEPRWWNPMSVAAVDEATNALEYLVHHEDVRRARPDWQPREVAPDVAEEVFRRTLRIAKLAFRRARLGLALARPGGEPATIRAGTPVVVVRGEPVELALWTYGRTGVARVDFEGDPADVERVRSYRNRL